MDDDITISNVLNKDDDLFMTLFTEWSNSSFRITIFSSGATPLAGEMKDPEINEFAKNLAKTRDEYLQAVRGSLSGKDEGIEFRLKDSKLRWKKGVWHQGIVDLEPVPLSTVFPDVLKQFLLRDKKLDGELQTLKHENEELKATQKMLKEKLESIIDLKNSIEGELYKKFVIVLNSKKEKIRELQTELQKKTISSSDCGKSELYDASTDDSEISGDEEADKSGKKSNSTQFRTKEFILNGRGKRDQFFKRQIEDDKEKMIDSEFEEDKKSKRYCKYNDAKSMREISTAESRESSVNKPSTSKSNDNLSSDRIESFEEKQEKNASKSRIAATVSQLSNPSEDSEEDLFC